MHRSVQAKTEKEDCKLVSMNINSAVFKILFKKNGFANVSLRRKKIPQGTFNSQGIAHKGKGLLTTTLLLLL